jgi:hypothetical protein
VEKFLYAICDPVTLECLADKRLAALTAPELLKIEQQLLAQPSLADQVAKVAAAPFAWHDVPEDVTTETFLDWFPEISVNLDAARYLACRARHLASCGHHEEAIKCCLQGMQIADQTSKPPVGITDVVRNEIRRTVFEAAYDVFGRGSISQHSLDILAKALTQTDEVSLFEEMLRAERAFFITGAEESFRKEWYRVPFSVAGACDCLDFYEAQFDLIDRPYATFAAWFHNQPTGKRNRFSLELIDASFLQGLRHAFERNRVMTRCLQVLIALAPRLANGQTPSIESLGLPEEIITDPFSGKHLILKYSAAGPILYSVGPNLIDDGGDFTDDRDIGLGP